MILFLIAKGTNLRRIACLVFLGFVGTGLHATSARAQEEMSSATVYRADLMPIEGSGVNGEVAIRVEGNSILVSVNAHGFPAGETAAHPQHIHENASCGDYGDALVPLDDNLPGEGGSFPTAADGGTVHYRASGASEAFDEVAGEDIDLANRTVVVHMADGTPAACGEVNPVDN